MNAPGTAACSVHLMWCDIELLAYNYNNAIIRIMHENAALNVKYLLEVLRNE